MKKNILVVLLIVSTLLFCASCKSDAEQNKKTNSASAVEDSSDVEQIVPSAEDRARKFVSTHQGQSLSRFHLEIDTISYLHRQIQDGDATRLRDMRDYVAAARIYLDDNKSILSSVYLAEHQKKLRQYQKYADGAYNSLNKPLEEFKDPPPPKPKPKAKKKSKPKVKKKKDPCGKKKKQDPPA